MKALLISLEAVGNTVTFSDGRAVVNVKSVVFFGFLRVLGTKGDGRLEFPGTQKVITAFVFPRFTEMVWCVLAGVAVNSLPLFGVLEGYKAVPVILEAGNWSKGEGS